MRWILVFFLFLAPAYAGDIDSKIADVLRRPAFRHAAFGISVFSLDRNKSVYETNADQFFVPGSTTKLVTVAAGLQLLGPDYRFHTKVYRTGDVDSGGKLNGDLVLVASGDPNLSGRLQTDGSLAFENEDHSYGGKSSSGIGDPLLVLRKLAGQIKDHGIKSIAGRVLVDASLLPGGMPEAGTGVIVSSIVVNDNVVDVIVTAGAKEGEPSTIRVSPQSYLQVENAVTTGKADTEADLNYVADDARTDGGRSVKLAGNVPAGSGSEMFAYSVPDPVGYARFLFRQALTEGGITIESTSENGEVDFEALSKSYAENLVVAEHVSAPFSEEAKVILKVSQNLHATLLPYLIGMNHGAKGDAALSDGFEQIKGFLSGAKLDVTAASQSDGAGGNSWFTPRFITDLLVYMSKQKTFPIYQGALPIMGRDGTLYEIQKASPAAGHVFAKTGTNVRGDLLNQRLLVLGKGLAGYVTTAKGEHLVFAMYLNYVPVNTPTIEAIQKEVGDVLGEIATAIYEK